MTTDEQFARLPKHAQETIRSLRRELDNANRRIEELEAELTPVPQSAITSRVFYEASLMESGRRPMPEGAYFHFRLDSGEVRVMLQRSRDDSRYWLDVNADHSLAVRPTSTNAIRVFTESRFNS